MFEMLYVALFSGAFYQICSDEGALGYKMAPPQRVVGLNHWKNIQKSSSSKPLASDAWN